MCVYKSRKNYTTFRLKVKKKTSTANTEFIRRQTQKVFFQTTQKSIALHARREHADQGPGAKLYAVYDDPDIKYEGEDRHY